MATPIDEIQRVFWPSGEPSQKIWAILDGARDKNVYWGLLNSYQNYACLYAGDLAPALEAVAPYLVQLDFDDRYTRDLLAHGWGRSWGVFLECDAAMPAGQRSSRFSKIHRPLLSLGRARLPCADRRTCRTTWSRPPDRAR